LFSGGDDKRVLLWNVLEVGALSSAINSRNPQKDQAIAVYEGHQNNIFGIAVDHNNQFMYSCGLDGFLLRHAVDRGETSKAQQETAMSQVAPQNDQNFREQLHGHTGAIYKIEMHPNQSEILYSCSEDGTVCGWDTRLPDYNVWRLQGQNEQNSFSIHPMFPFLFVTSAGNDLNLFDLRYVNFKKPQRTIVTNYLTKLCRQESRGRPTMTSVIFHTSGNMFLVAMQYYLPTLYLTCDVEPFMSFYTEGYRNMTTIKTFPFCFGYESLFQGEEFIACGSDTYKIHLFQLPKTLLHHGNPERPPPNPENQFLNLGVYSETRFLSSEGPFDRYWISRETHQTIRHYRSNVNMITFHESLPLMASSGVEKAVHLHTNLQDFFKPMQAAIKSDELLEERRHAVAYPSNWPSATTTPTLQQEASLTSHSSMPGDSRDNIGLASVSESRRMDEDLFFLINPQDPTETSLVSSDEDPAVFRLFDRLNASENHLSLFRFRRRSSNTQPSVFFSDDRHLEASDHVSDSSDSSDINSSSESSGDEEASSRETYQN
jgi:WD domain, G-beta repeat